MVFLRGAEEEELSPQEVLDPDLRHPGLGVEGDLLGEVVVQGRVRHLHHKENILRAGQALAVVPRPKQGKIRFQVGVRGQGQGPLHLDKDFGKTGKNPVPAVYGVGVPRTYGRHLVDLSL